MENTWSKVPHHVPLSGSRYSVLDLLSGHVSHEMIPLLSLYQPQAILQDDGYHYSGIPMTMYERFPSKPVHWLFSVLFGDSRSQSTGSFLSCGRVTALGDRTVYCDPSVSLSIGLGHIHMYTSIYLSFGVVKGRASTKKLQLRH